MAGISGMITSTVLTMLQAQSDGVNARIGAIEKADASLSKSSIRSIAALNTSVEISEKTGHANYPSLMVYCDKLSNLLIEKFRRFSGKAHLVIEVRNTDDRLEAVEGNTQVYVDGVCALLDDARGDWGCGLFYAGGYDVNFEPVVRGGKNFLQRAKVGFEIQISR